MKIFKYESGNRKGMKIRKSNDNLRGLIEDLNRYGSEKKIGVWKAVAKGLNKPKRKTYEVNVGGIEKHSKAKETIVVPGAVLGSGEIKKTVTIAALKFSKEAREKIEKSGGSCLEISELFEKNPKGHKIRIMG